MSGFKIDKMSIRYSENIAISISIGYFLL